MKRKPAPQIVVQSIHVDERAETLRKLDAEDPEFVHSFELGNVSSAKLAKEGKEIVKRDEKPVSHGDDIVVRRRRDMAQARADFETQHSLDLAKKTVKEGRQHELAKEHRFRVVKAKPEGGAE